jgi:TRAP-type mannitol/chloroaromatic compound transport system permease small subunit
VFSCSPFEQAAKNKDAAIKVVSVIFFIFPPFLYFIYLYFNRKGLSIETDNLKNQELYFDIKKRLLFLPKTRST